MVNVKYAAVMVSTESGDHSVHLLQYLEGYPESAAETLRNLYDPEEFSYISNVFVDAQGDHCDIYTIGRTGRRIKEEILKLVAEERRG